MGGKKRRRRKKLLEGRIALPQEYPYVCLRREGRKEEENEGGWDIERKKSLHKKPKKCVCGDQGTTTHVSEDTDWEN